LEIVMSLESATLAPLEVLLEIIWRPMRAK
jgi:hypothetical protein